MLVIKKVINLYHMILIVMVLCQDNGQLKFDKLCYA